MGILTDHADAILFGRASVIRDRRGDGRPYWRLYLETGSGPNLHRQRVYVGPEGGLELRQAIGELRQAFWGSPGGPRGFLKAQTGQDAQEAQVPAGPF